MSLVLFITFMVKISSCGKVPGLVWFVDQQISSLLFVGDVVLLAPSCQDLLHELGWFTAKCEVAGIF